MKTTDANASGNFAVSPYLACERREIYALLMLSAGMMGAYTFNQMCIRDSYIPVPAAVLPQPSF